MLGGTIWALFISSLIYYAWWNPKFLPLIIGSILINHFWARRIHRTRVFKGYVLTLGVALNLLLLFFFKYANFSIDVVNQISNAGVGHLNVVLPIGISFFTFQQIAYLVDVRRGHTKPKPLIEYALFVSFFPQLIAGPIVHHRDFTPQIKNLLEAFKLENINKGISIFTIGLFKKTVLADNLSLLVTPVFNDIAHGNLVNIFDAWVGAVAYTFQIYFDFSGYSDMAVGIGCLFGIRLPINFYSPYQSSSIIEFWRRWHITLSNFLRDYVYFPFGGGRVGQWRKTLNVFLTMLIGGVWHGAGWTFIVWGAMHGVAISINHIWRATVQNSPTRFGRYLSPGATFIFVVFAWVVFRSPNMESALSLWKIMIGAGQIIIPAEWGMWFEKIGANVMILGEFHSKPLAIILVACLIAWGFPNTKELFPDISLDENNLQQRISRFQWKPNAVWLSLTLICLLVSLWNMSTVSEFLYYQF
ncbi:MAG: MBOAT family protein [Desulfobacterium sp.]|nr:MBOAT family protein [Desulfobacterium sp.]